MNQSSNNKPSRDRKDSRKIIGKQGEVYALELLRQNDYEVLAHNWRCKTGEIDLIAEKDNMLIFVEVRTRTGTKSFGTAKESVNYRKQNKVKETAQVYIHLKRKYDARVRFDVITVLLAQHTTNPVLEHIENAF